MAKSDVIRIYGTGRNKDKFISFGADPEVLLHDYDSYVKFVKACEFAVRKDDRYKKYVGKVRQAGFDHCAIIGHVVEKNDNVDLEMHHGSLFTLFDYCDIVLKASMRRGKIKDLCSFDVADQVLTEHELDNVQVVFLTKTAHKAVHKGDAVFIDIKATVGRVDRFIDRWYDGMEDNHWQRVEKYIKLAEKHRGEMTDSGLFDVAEKLKSFK